MSKELMNVLITKMHVKLNRLIENSNFNLLSDEVQHYSRRLDRALTHYNKRVEHKTNFEGTSIILNRAIESLVK